MQILFNLHDMNMSLTSVTHNRSVLGIWGRYLTSVNRREYINFNSYKLLFLFLYNII